MTHEEFYERSIALKDAMESETRDLEAELIRAKAKVERLEARLSGIREQYQRRSTALMNVYMGIAEDIPVEEASAPGEKKRRGILDEPILELAKEISSPDVTAAQLEAAWNSRNTQPSLQLNNSAVRGILDRLAQKGRLQITDPGGGRGSGIPRKYRPA